MQTLRTLATALSATLLGCGGTSSPATSTATATTNPYVTAYQAARWQSNTTVSFPSACSMTYVTNGVPAVHASFYLAPAGNGQAVVATTPTSHLALAVIAYPAASLKGNTVTLNVCPTPAATATATPMGAIGFLISGIALFNSYEATSAVALADNISYTFTDTSGTMQTASFIDTCASHPAAGMGSTGSTWHYHGNPTCVTPLVDTAGGPSHLLGFALDGYPIYGGRDINGALIATNQLDACNGITSATPDFATPMYHYVLPIGITTSQSSISCFHGTVNAAVAAAARRLACTMPGMTVATLTAPTQGVRPTQLRPASNLVILSKAKDPLSDPRIMG